MGMYSQLHQLSPDYAQKLLQNPDEVHYYVDKADSGRLPKEAQGEDLNLDKAWHGLHYLLTGTAWQGAEPACYLLAGGTQIGYEQEHDVCGYGPARILTPAQVANFEASVVELTLAEIRRRYNPEEMTRLEIYPEIWSRKDDEAQSNFEFLAEAAQELQGFLQRAASNGKAVIIYLA
jgi:hypothetical protein